MRKTCLNEIYALAQKDTRVVFVGSDLGSGVLDDFKTNIPQRFFMEGVSEQYCIGMMAGLAASGFIPYFNTIAVFAYRRCLEQLILDVALPNLPVRITGSGGGYVYAPLGPSHLATDDIAILRTVPNMTILAPADATEMKRLMPQTLTWPGPIYIRIAKGGDPIVTPTDEVFEIGKAVPIAKGNDILFLTTGITLGIAREARESLQEQGIAASILHLPTIKPLDEAAVLTHISKVKAIISIEEGVVSGGLGSAVAELCMDQGISKPFKRIGIPDEFTKQYGSQANLLTHYGIDTSNVVYLAQRLLGKKEHTSRHLS